MLGTVKPRQRTDAPDHARELEEIVLRDYKGVPVRLGDLWRDRPAVLVFLRHYGCHFCRDHAVRLYRDREKFDAAGVRLAVIGQGEPAQAADFRHSQSVDLPLLVDRKRENARGRVSGPPADATDWPVCPVRRESPSR